MAIKALCIDFYGTLVWDNDALIRDICSRISGMSRMMILPSDVAMRWWTLSQEYVSKYHGENFKSMHDLEEMALSSILSEFKCYMEPSSFADEIFTEMKRPHVFDDASLFLAKLPLEYVVLCNADRDDIERGVEYSGLAINKIICSQDAKSYKPSEEIFRCAVKELGFNSDEVLHIGDSINSDIIPAQNIGMKTAYLNRYSKALPEGFDCDYMCKTLIGLKGIIK